MASRVDLPLCVHDSGCGGSGSSSSSSGGGGGSSSSCSSPSRGSPSRCEPLPCGWLDGFVSNLPADVPAAPARQQRLKQRLDLGSGLGITQAAASKVVRRSGALLVLFVGAATWRALTAGSSSPSDLEPELGVALNTASSLQESPRRLGCACEDSSQDDIGFLLCSPVSLTTKANYNSICSSGKACLKEDQRWQLALYFIGVLYMFAALAIVCDEFFVPSLEYFCDEYEISPDVAGATFMAAGGSMPELFTSFIGTFKGSSVGVAAIVGSAVFNVLFVIATCAVASSTALELTWWPLFRDCCYYMFTLVTLALFFSGGWSKDVIEWWEALVLFSQYIGYCIVMKYNQKIYSLVAPATAKVSPVSPESEEGETSASNANFLQPSTFRTSIVQLLIQNEHICDIVGMAAVVKVAGTLKETFNLIDKDGSGDIDASELQQLLTDLGLNRDSRSMEVAMKTINRNAAGKIGFEEFKKWYMASEARIEIKMRRIFEKFDRDGSGFIEHEEVALMLKSLGHNPSAEDVRQAMKLMIEPAAKEEGDIKVSDIDGPSTHPASANDDNPDHIQDEQPEDLCNDAKADVPDVLCAKISFTEFQRWYLDSLFWQEKEKQMKTEADTSEAFSIDMPEKASLQQLTMYVVTYPICAALYVTMPDVRRERTQSVFVAVLEFLLSLMWIAVFSISLVEWTEVISNTLGLPIPVAGITILAAGTSIPDLLSSYIVAKQGKGDMAVSSSIGSNIFDVTVGLPLPWLLWSATHEGKEVKVDATGIGFFISLLVLMVFLIVVTIKLCNWKMTKCLGYTMFLFYFVFIVLFLMVQMPEGNPVMKVPF